MERLTSRKNGNAYAVGCPCFEIPPKANRIIQCAIDRLAAYEDTGLEPCDYSTISHALEKADRAQSDLTEMMRLAGGIGLDRLREIAEANTEGRCGIPPVKMHQKIFRVFNGEIYEEIVCNAIWEPLKPHSRWKVFTMPGGLPYFWNEVFGKTVFLTHADAQAALRREQE